MNMAKESKLKNTIKNALSMLLSLCLQEANSGEPASYFEVREKRQRALRRDDNTVRSTTGMLCFQM